MRFLQEIVRDMSADPATMFAGFMLLACIVAPIWMVVRWALS